MKYCYNHDTTYTLYLLPSIVFTSVPFLCKTFSMSSFGSMSLVFLFVAVHTALIVKKSTRNTKNPKIIPNATPSPMAGPLKEKNSM